MTIHFLAGDIAPESILIDTSLLERSYFENVPDTKLPEQRVVFGTSGHRGTSVEASFTESHILAIVQAICDYRNGKGYTGPLFLGKDTHFLSRLAERNALEVLAANDVSVCYQADNGFTPTPVISWSILKHNNLSTSSLSDGIVITPSHNPPSDGGIKYNPPNGGPADVDVTRWIQDRANAYLSARLSGVKRLTFEAAVSKGGIAAIDFAKDYVADLCNIIDMKLIADSGIRIGVDPLGGAGFAYWDRIAGEYGLNITVVNRSIDPRFAFMTVDHDGKIRMDCSSQYAMRRLVALKDEFDVAFANDPDADRHGIVVSDAGLMNPNHYLATAIQYLFTHRSDWSRSLGVGKTLVSSGIIDRVADSLGIKLVEVPVGFKWFVNGLFNGTLGFCGEESAGASFLRFNGKVWSTDKDGIILNLLAAEILAKTGKSPGKIYRELEAKFGKSFYTRIDQPTTPQQKAAFQGLTANKVKANELAGDVITDKLTNAPGNGALIGGLKVASGVGWFAVRPSGTENIYKIYAESLRSESHLNQIISEAKAIVESIKL
ncbi:MAG: phosphoglucomutase (alpha-D-glucose-1,6-bisphosphate-dependent) [Planctomycetaceae bacterium]|jgi:phosphoglucomutase|nr:phosphoglucomutase (alpha-D-glucose-1,6-bisphosphate-dependent) [Planctomycetaceae bacterium]